MSLRTSLNKIHGFHACFVVLSDLLTLHLWFHSDLFSCFVCMHECTWCPWNLEEGVGSPGTRGTDGCEPPARRVLGTEPESSGTSAAALDHGVILQARTCYSMVDILQS